MKNSGRLYSGVRIFFYLLSASIFLLPLPSRTEDVKIVKVLDCNLFEIKGGKRIRLAHVDAVSVTDKIKRVSSFAHNIKYYAEREFVGQTLMAEYIDASNHNFEPLSVHLIRKFPLKTVNYNKLYLERGYGKYMAESDTVYSQEYLAAEEMAKLKNRGVWDKDLYSAENPKVSALSFMFGFGNYQELNGYYREASLMAEPIGSSNSFGMRVTAVFSRQGIEYGGYKEGLEMIWFNPFWVINSKYAGIEPGFVMFKSSDIEYAGWISGFFIWPSIKFNMGYMKMIFLSFDYFTDLLYSPASFGLNFLNETPYLKLWLGYTPVDEERQFWSFKIEGLATQRLLIKFQGIYYDYIQNDESSYGWRIGVGYVLD